MGEKREYEEDRGVTADNIQKKDNRESMSNGKLNRVDYIKKLAGSHRC